MVNNANLFNSFKKNGVDFFTGIPDSLLKNFCAYITDHAGEKEHIITANEGGAVAFAAGYHLSTGKIPLVYLQNSGLGNAINPLLSMADKEVYSIPMLLMIGWRGKPGVKDEPQHITQGRIQNDLLDVIEIPYRILNAETPDINRFVRDIVELARKERSPVAVIVPPDTFEAYKLIKDIKTDYDLNREGAIEIALSSLSPEDIVVSTTGKTSREVFECRERCKQGHQNDFYTVGSMGHASQIALGIALNTNRKVVCLDGDGSVIMHMGSLVVNGTHGPENFIHIVINNGAHDSVGGQPTAGFEIDLVQIARSCGYRNVETASKKDDIKDAAKRVISKKGPSLLEIKVNKGARSNLGRPTKTPLENKSALMDFLGKKI